MILVTGGAGFIGSHIVDALVEQGHAVRAVDALLPVAHAARPTYLNPAAEWIEGDLRDRPWPSGRSPASTRSATRRRGRPRHRHRRHRRLRRPQRPRHGAVLLRALAGSGFAGRLVLASSMVVYGEGSYRCARHGEVARGRGAPRRSTPAASSRRARSAASRSRPGTVDEDAPLDPRSVYAATKVAQEHLGAAFSRETGVPVIALRYHNVYGPRMPRDTPYAGVASIFRSALEAGRAPRVFEDGGQRRDFVHVRDVARANLCALLAAEPVAGAFNVASGTPHSVLEMAAALADAFDGAARPVVTGEWRGGDVRHIVASRRARRRRARLPRARGVRGRHARVRDRSAALMAAAGGTRRRRAAPRADLPPPCGRRPPRWALRRRWR